MAPRLVALTATVIDQAGHRTTAERSVQVIEPITVQAWPAPAGAPVATALQVSASGMPLSVYDTPVAYYAYFASSGGDPFIQISNGVQVTSAVVRDWSAEWPATVIGNTISTYMPGAAFGRSDQITVEINGNMAKPLIVHRYDLSDVLPSITDPNVIVVGPGYVNGGDTTTVVPAGKTLFVRPGTYWDKAKVRIGPASSTGTAVSSGRIVSRGVMNSATLTDPGRPIRIQKCAATSGNPIVVDGGAWLGRDAWGIVAYWSSFVNIQNVTVLNWRTTGTPDGVDFVGSTDCRLEDSTIVAYDDGCAVKTQKTVNGWGPKDAGRISVARCFFRQGDAGNGVQIGRESDPVGSSIVDVSYTDIGIYKTTRVSDTNFRSCIGIQVVDGALVDRVTYTRVKAFASPGNHENFICMKIWKNGESVDPVALGKIDHVTFEDCELFGPALPSIMSGGDATHQISNTKFDNLRIGGQKATSASQAGLAPSNTTGTVWV